MIYMKESNNKALQNYDKNFTILIELFYLDNNFFWFG